MKRTESETEVTLFLESSARVGEAETLAKEFRDLLSTSVPLVSLDLVGLEVVDVSFYQLLLALHQSLVDTGRHLILRPLTSDHPVSSTARLLGIPLEHHFTMVEALP